LGRLLFVAGAVFILTACESTPEQAEPVIAAPAVDYARRDLVGLPADITGCVEETRGCYVVGRPVQATLRFEPQTGRHWFLDPGTGRTFYADGEFRSGDLVLPGAAPMPGTDAPRAFGS
jgi:hypothetical protein